MNNRVNSTLKSDSGASIIFVLCTMLFVMTIGVSVLVASSAAAGAATDSQTLAKAELYSDSLIRTFTKSLKGDMGKKIVVSVANEGLKGDVTSNPTDFSPREWISREIKIENLPEKSSYGVTSKISAPANNTSLNKSMVTNYTFVPEMPKIPDIPEIKDTYGSVVVTKVPGAPREPSVLTMTLEAVVNTTVKYGGKTVSVNSTYVCEGIEIYDNDVVDTDDAVVDTDDKFGEWRLVKIEKVE